MVVNSNHIQYKALSFPKVCTSTTQNAQSVILYPCRLWFVYCNVVLILSWLFMVTYLYKASEKIGAILSNQEFCYDVAILPPVHQTSCLEAFHSVICSSLLCPSSQHSRILEWCHGDTVDIFPGVVSTIHCVPTFKETLPCTFHYNKNCGKRKPEREKDTWLSIRRGDIFISSMEALHMKGKTVTLNAILYYL